MKMERREALKKIKRAVKKAIPNESKSIKDQVIDHILGFYCCMDDNEAGHTDEENLQFVIDYVLGDILEGLLNYFKREENE